VAPDPDPARIPTGPRPLYKISIGRNKKKINIKIVIKKKKCYLNKLLRIEKYLNIFNFNKVIIVINSIR